MIGCNEKAYFDKTDDWIGLDFGPGVNRKKSSQIKY